MKLFVTTRFTPIINICDKRVPTVFCFCVKVKYDAVYHVVIAGVQYGAALGTGSGFPLCGLHWKNTISSSPYANRSEN